MSQIATLNKKEDQHPVTGSDRSERQPSVVVVGKESVGKSQLISSFTGKAAYSANFQGSTVYCEMYEGPGVRLVDTPGILRKSDSMTTQLALKELREGDQVLIVVPVTRIDRDLRELLPLVTGKRGSVVITFGDKAPASDQLRQNLEGLAKELGVPISLVNARQLSDAKRAELNEQIHSPATFRTATPKTSIDLKVEPKALLFDRPIIGPLLAIVILFAPAIAAVWLANSSAAALEGPVMGITERLAQSAQNWPAFLRILVAERYGLIQMGPLLLVWVLPTVVLYAFFIGAYKASGIVDRINTALHHLVRPFGLAGRDLTRIMMGFGCNVPAVINSRSSSPCSRGSCISAIAFGSSCSYQQGATLAVFTAAGMAWLVVPYLSFLVVSTLIYLRLTAPSEARSKLNVLAVGGRNFLEWPQLSAVWREARLTIIHFLRNAMPIFIAITFFASILDWVGLLELISTALSPLMAVFRLPPEAALPVVMACIRKDGILLFSEQGLAVQLTAWQMLAGVYLAGVLLPCIVTLYTIAREQSFNFAFKLVARQAVGAVAFTLILAWAGVLFSG